MSTKRKKIPTFKTEDQERAFWAKRSPLDYFDPATARQVRFPDLKPTMKSISIRLPVSMVENLKILANREDVPYQSLAKIFLNRQIRIENRSRSARFRAPRRRSAEKQVVH